MFTEQNKIIIVDNDQAELDTLSKAFLTSGIGCKSILYTQAYESPLKGIRIAFFDINITEQIINLDQDDFDFHGDPSLSTAFNGLAFALQSCIHRDNGPFALVFWTKNSKLVENFIDFVRERYPDLPSPILIDTIDKHEFQGKTSEELQNKIEDIFRGKSISLLFEFENKCTTAAEEVVDSLYKIVPKNPGANDKIWANSIGFEENFEIIFSKIAIQTLGHTYAKEKPDIGVMEGLIPVLNHLLIANSVDDVVWKNFLRSLTQTTKVEYPAAFSRGLLNTIFHIDTISKITPSTRGAVYEYIIHPSTFFVSLFRFNEIEKKSNSLYNKFFTFNMDRITMDEKDKVRGLSTFIAIEISTACDFSQNKSRNNKFLLGLLTPNIPNDQINMNTMSESIFYKDLPEFEYKSQNLKVWVNFNYVFSDFSLNKNFGKPLFIFKKEIMDMIGNRYANYVSRIGITTF